MLHPGNARTYLALRSICVIFRLAIGSPDDIATPESPQYEFIHKDSIGCEPLYYI